jgi:hypothetical protein
MTRKVHSYFELSEDDLVEEQLTPVSFGEFLVEQGGLSRAHLYEALREQDRHPGIPLGEIVAYMGYLPYAEVDRLLTRWNDLPIVEIN